MQLHEFLNSLQDENPPPGISPELEALWFVETGLWDTAHEMVKYNDSENNAWVHAYLHRKKDENKKAKKHYSIANKIFPTNTPKEEFIQIAEDFLEERGFCIVDDF